MTGKVVAFQQTVLLVITLASLFNKGIFCSSLHYIPHMCETKNDSSEECGRLITKSLHAGNGSMGATKFTVKYSLYNGIQQPQTFTSDDFENKIHKLIYHPGAQWKVLIHGFLNSDFTKFPGNVRDAYLRNMEKNSSAKYNVLVVDWGDGACDSNVSPSSRNASTNVKFAGIKLSALLSKLHELKLLNVVKDVHMIGHGLGSYVAELAALRVFMNNFYKPLWRISALDPVGSLFWQNSLFMGRLRRYPRHHIPVWVFDVYHTSTLFGESNRIGDVNFYINGGNFQPSCEMDLFGFSPNFNTAKTLLQLCSHNYATEIFAKSIGNSSIKACSGCYSYSEYDKGECDCEETPVLGEQVVHETIKELPPTLGAVHIKTKWDTSVGRNYIKLLKNNNIFFTLFWKGWKPLCFKKYQ